MPRLKDPNFKISVWALLKDNVGKDLTRITMPVFLNAPIGGLQSIAGFCEYHYILDDAANETNSLRRLALVCANSIATYSSVERIQTKPFNALLGETYEFKDGDVTFFAEQVSHHPPIAAQFARGKHFI